LEKIRAQKVPYIKSLHDFQLVGFSPLLVVVAVCCPQKTYPYIPFWTFLKCPFLIFHMAFQKIYVTDKHPLVAL